MKGSSVVDVVATQASASSEQATTSATVETMTVSESVSLDSGRVTIERDSVGLPMAINWRRSVTGSAANGQSERRHEDRAAEAQAAAEVQSHTRKENSDRITETEQRSEPFWRLINIVMPVATSLILCFFLWEIRKK